MYKFMQKVSKTNTKLRKIINKPYI